VSLLQYKNKCRNIANIDMAINEYNDNKALIDKQFNDSVDLLHQDMDKRISLLRVEREEQLIAAWINLMVLIIPSFTENDLSTLVELGALPAPVGPR